MLGASLASLPATAGAESGDYLSRRDTISLSAGNASRANIAIQTPTPWPSYINDTDIPGSGPRAVNAIQSLNKTQPKGAAPVTLPQINFTPPSLP